MNVLIAYIGYGCGAGLHLKKALRCMKNKVCHIGPDPKGYIPWAPERDFAERDTPDIALPYPLSSFPLVEAIARCPWPVDLVIECDANFGLTGHAKVPVVCWAVDNHVSGYPASADANLFLGAHSWGHHHADPNFGWLPCAYDSEEHYPLDVVKEFDLLFLGVIYEHRAQYLNALAPYGKVGMGMGVLGKEYNEGYNSARMGFCLSACGDVPMRVFENAAQGLLIFCDRQRDLEKFGLADGIHYVGFDSIPEAVSKFQELLSDPEEVQEIAHNGQAALRYETYEQRVQEIFSYLG
jgi:hypothetical protein